MRSTDSCYQHLCGSMQGYFMVINPSQAEIDKGGLTPEV